MFDLDKWQEIWNTITANKMRSVMTGFGVFWGIFMLVILIGVGNAFQGGMEQNIKGFATNSGFFFTNVTSEPYKGFRKGRWWNMNNRDLEIIKQKATALEYISPMLFGESSSKNVVMGRKSTSAQVMGVYPDQFKIQTQTVIKGRLFNDLDIRNVSKVALIGKTVAENLFDSGQDPIGAYIRVNGIYFQVVGVIRPNSKAQIGGDAETSVYIPFSTMQKAFNQGDIIHFMGATAKEGMSVSTLEDQIKTILKANHNIAPNDEKAVRSFNIEKEFKTFANLFLGIRTLIWIVGLGSLLSGIIGVSNIMLVTVRERTREIGVRRALGAKPVTIVSQIVSESFILTFIAGFGGLFFGVIILELISIGMRGGASEDMFFIPPFISFGTALVSMSILIASGLFAGLMPALRALSIKAIDAIREE
ncbi:ABC transporter permease [Dysgonomonas sp. HDW5B]|uniref:ABC transporter permease n=1 Tax=Dysgonomonas sp. HDW5B TaxID=2714927 RepID=UPI001407F30D|nr:ABC transporter permease [Dysgonomonas sp. HDW5B]QIK53910.1 ABC transporter permease [Dysgonomonas sp. HDW5B]